MVDGLPESAFAKLGVSGKSFPPGKQMGALLGSSRGKSLSN